MRLLPIVLLLSIVTLGCGQGGGPPQLPGSGQQSLPKLPGDDVEGSIWEYRATPKSDVGKTDIPTDSRSGRFRVEGNAVFDAQLALTLPPREKVRSVAEKLKRGEGMELRLPEPPRVKRIGEYKRLTKGRVRIDFNDKETLHGLMIMWPKKDSPGVWLGTYKEQEGRRTTSEWVVELREIQD